MKKISILGDKKPHVKKQKGREHAYDFGTDCIIKFDLRLSHSSEKQQMFSLKSLLSKMRSIHS